MACMLPVPEFVVIMREGIPSAICLTLGTAVVVDLLFSKVTVVSALEKLVFIFAPGLIFGALLVVMAVDYARSDRPENINFFEESYGILLILSFCFCVCARAVHNFKIEMFDQ